MREDILHWVALNGISGIGLVTFSRLLEAFGTPEGAFKASADSLSRIQGIRTLVVEGISEFKDWGAAEKEISKAEKSGIDIITMEDDAYPVNLKNAEPPPPVLYVKGKLIDEDRIAVAIVGSRTPTQYGIKMTFRIGGELASKGITIVSGMARGIDSASHEAALESGGRTIAVLGSGADVIYPRENKKLYEQIIESGAVISQFPLGASPDGKNFPIRNRTIAGLSLGVAIVQATRPDSGALITAKLALELNREVFAVPGDADAKASFATNRLIKTGGAMLVDEASDIIDEILPQVPKELLKSLPEQQAQTIEQAPATKESIKPNIKGDEMMVYEALGSKPIQIDDLAGKVSKPVHEVSRVLTTLELKGLIKQLPGMMYVVD